MSGQLDPTQFTRESAERIARVVRAAELSVPQVRPLSFERVDAPRKEKVIRVCTFTGAWGVDSLKTVVLSNGTTTTETVSATNMFFDLPSNGETPCLIAKADKSWYLVSSRCTSVDVITGATLGTTGLVFIKSTMFVPATVHTASITIGTTACA